MSNEIDLTQLPAPKAIEYENFEALLAQNKQLLIDSLPVDVQAAMRQVLQLESEPIVKLLEVLSYTQLIESERVNEAVKAGMLAFATASDLDHFAAGSGLKRKIIQAANPNTNPATPEILETDEEFRRRIQMHPEKFAAAGPRAAYIAHALDVKNVVDANVIRPIAGTVQVFIKSYTDSGQASGDLCAQVLAYLSDETRRPLCDTVLVDAAKPKAIAIEYISTYESGPDKELVKQKQDADLQKLLQDYRGIKSELALSKIIGALDSPGVKKVTLLQPTTDIVCADDEYILITQIQGSEA